MNLNEWLSGEIAVVEALLAGAGPTCQLDRQGASPPSLKEAEGRYFILRRASRLLELGQPLDGLATEADKAREFLAADEGLARNPAWRAYFKGVLDAVQALRQQADGASMSPGN